MSYVNPEFMAFKDGRDVDAYHRLRVSQPFSIFSSFNEFGGNSREFVTQAVGTGAMTFLPNEATLQLSTGGTASGAAFRRQTRLNWQATSGRSVQLTMSFAFGAPVTNAFQRVGYFDSGNGLVLEQTPAGVRLIRRTDISGSPVDFAVEQADWNIDPMDGTGPSGFDLDWSLRQTLHMDIQYTGTGRARIGFIVNGVIVFCHEFFSGNVLLSVQVRTPNLPLRTEVENTGVASDVATLKIVGMSISVEAGDEELPRGALHGASNGIAEIGVTTRRPILSIRARATINGLPNRGWIIPYDYGVIARTNAAYIEVVAAGALTGAVWTQANFDSIAEYDVSATAIAGGAVAITGFAAAGSGSTSIASISDVIDQFPQTINSLDNSVIGISLVATSFSGTSNVSGFLNWREVF